MVNVPDQLSHSAVDHYMRGNTVVHCVADLQAKEMISVAPIVAGFNSDIGWL